jgi:hypothetical protein
VEARLAPSLEQLAENLTNARSTLAARVGCAAAHALQKSLAMHMDSRCFTVRPTAAPREAYSVLVIDRTVGETEDMCATLREDGHLVDALTFADDLEQAIGELKYQAIVIRMRLGTAARTARDRVKRAFPHLLVITFNASNTDEVREQLPTRWTELFELSAPPAPRLCAFPRAVREAMEEKMSPRYARM